MDFITVLNMTLRHATAVKNLNMEFHFQVQNLTGNFDFSFETGSSLVFPCDKSNVRKKTSGLSKKFFNQPSMNLKYFLLIRALVVLIKIFKIKWSFHSFLYSGLFCVYMYVYDLIEILFSLSFIPLISFIVTNHFNLFKKKYTKT